jgi:hypothetical protein
MKKIFGRVRMGLIVFLVLGLVLSSFRRETTMISKNTIQVLVSASDTTRTDPETGLIVDPNLYMVKAQCTGCHSTKLIVANHFTRDGWKQKIRWMQANHNLWDLGETEKQVLDYLEKNYAPGQMASRRAPLKDIRWYDLKVK